MFIQFFLRKNEANETEESDGKRLNFGEAESDAKRKGEKARKQKCIHRTPSWSGIGGKCLFDADKYCLHLGFQKCAFAV